MFTVIKDLPDDVLGIKIGAKLTHKDYVERFIPLFEERLKTSKPLKVLCVIDESFIGMELAAMWDDTKFGVKHWNDISHFAIVTDEGWIKSIAALFSPFYPGIVRCYGLDELAQAEIWITEPDPAVAA